MKIGFFTDRYYPQIDGVAVSVDLFAKELRKLGHEVYIFCPAAKKELDEPDYVVRFPSIPTIWYEDHRDTFPWTPANIAKVKKYNLDIVHIHTPAQIGFLGVLIARQQGQPVVTTYHTDIEQYSKIYKRLTVGVVLMSLVGPALLRDRELFQKSVKNILPSKRPAYWNKKVITRNLVNFLDGCQLVISPSKKITHKLHGYHTRVKIITLPTGIDPYEIIKPSRLNLRTKFKISDDSKILLFVGRLGEEKNIQLIVKAVADILKEKSDVHLVLVGDGPYHSELEELSNQLGISGHVHFTGPLNRQDTYACYQNADVFCFASTTDTQGLVINEAAYAGLPIVFVDDKISPLTVHRKSGLKSPNGVRGFAHTILTLLNNPDKISQYGKQAQEMAKRITIEKQAKKLLGYYQDLS